jgi:hypothetical protein
MGEKFVVPLSLGDVISRPLPHKSRNGAQRNDGHRDAIVRLRPATQSSALIAVLRLRL